MSKHSEELIELPPLLDEKGNEVGKISGETVETRWLTRNEKISDCQAYCDTLPNCYSFNYQRDPKKCYFKDRKLTGNEPLMCREDYFTVYKKCSQGI